MMHCKIKKQKTSILSRSFRCQVTRTYIVLTLLSFSFTSLALGADFSVEIIGDYGNVSVFESSDNYGAVLTDGSLNAAARQELAKTFFNNHEDGYDFLVVFTNFDFIMPEGDPEAFYLGIKNDTQGVGLDIFDHTESFGSGGKLQGILDMGNVHGMPPNQIDIDFEKVLRTLAHEIMHRWGAYIRFKDASGNDSNKLLHYDLDKHAAHWSFLLDTDGSVLYGNDWRDNGDGTFSSVNIYKYFSPLDLYLMGFYEKSQVPPMLLIDNPDVDPAKPPEVGVNINGTPTYVTIDDIIAAEGERLPHPSDSQKSFKLAFILLTRPGTFTTQELAALESLREAWITRFAVLTDGLGTMDVAATQKLDLPVNPGITLPPLDPRPAGPSLDDAVTWMIEQQATDGSWRDTEQTGRRDTAAAVMALIDFDSAQAQYNLGLQWLGSSESVNMVYLSQKILSLVDSGENLIPLQNELLNGQNPDGGWGSHKHYVSNPTDTSHVLKALVRSGYDGSETLSNAIAYLKTNQNADGGWGGDNRKSNIDTTVNVLMAFNGLKDRFVLNEQITGAIAWLIQKQNPDHGFGNSPSTIYDTAAAIMALLEHEVSPDILGHAVNYILDHQSKDGSWYGSAHQTAMAVQAVFKATIDLDLSIKTDDVTFIPDTISELPTEVTISAIVKNLGRTDVPQATIALFEDKISDENKIEEQIITLAGQSSETVTFSMTITDATEHRYMVVADPNGLWKEFNEFNNSVIKHLTYTGSYDFMVSSTDISLSANPVTYYDEVAITAKVTNRGTLDAYNVQLKYFIDDPDGDIAIATTTVNILAGASIDNTVTWESRPGRGQPVTERDGGSVLSI